MAHFAQLDSNNIVQQVIVINNTAISDENGIEQESLGIALCKNLFGQDTNWKQTSYNSNFRKNYAGIGYKYNEQYDAFEPPQPYPSWTLNYSTFRWEPPIPEPGDGNSYTWDETTKTWHALTNDGNYQVE
jgi:hypothetical protein